jgi:hypothetical protein
MDSSQRAQVRLILEHEVALRQVELDESIRAIYTRNAAAGSLKSGGTIKSALRTMEKLATEFINRSIDQTAAVAMDPEAFTLVHATFLELQNHLGKQLNGVVKMATGHTRESRKSDSAYREADRLFQEQQNRATRLLEIHRFSFTKPASPERTKSALSAPSQASRRGRMLAAHWDEMWADIAMQIYEGDLQPTKQADIENAMKDWFATRELDAGDTPIRDRARVLWRKWQDRG